MSLPNFTADASLYKSSQHYLARTFTQAVGDIQPAQSSDCDPNCIADCRDLCAGPNSDERCINECIQALGCCSPPPDPPPPCCEPGCVDCRTSLPVVQPTNTGLLILS